MLDSEKMNIQFSGIKKQHYNKPECVVMGLSITSLGVIRSLGRKGVKVIGIDHLKAQLGSYSKYCETLYCPEPQSDGNDLLVFLKNLGKELNLRGVLLSTNDSFILFLARNQSILKPYFKFLLPKKEVIEALNDKRRLYQMAKQIDIDVPRTFFPQTIEELIDISRKIHYPCILKPAYGYLFNQVEVKGIVAKERPQLLEGWRRLHSLGNQVVLQEFVCGDDDLQYSLATYFNQNSEPLTVFTARKLRQNPPEAGVGTLVESCKEPAIVELGISFLKKIGFIGIAEVEFKRQGKHGPFKMIEVNTRLWVQNSLAVRCGVDIPWVAYCDACELELKGNPHQKDSSIKWLNFSADFRGCFGSSGYLSKRKITFVNWMKSLRGPKEFAIFSDDDIFPFVKSLWTFLFSLFQIFIKRVRMRFGFQN